jgi:phospholipid/cholesterol/gamma-HCH transport system substrate-binding protein
MPRTRSLAWAELKIGLVSLFALGATALLIFLLGGESGFFWQQYGLKTIFPNVAGLKPGAPVRLAGVEVGSVDEVALVGDRVEVSMKVLKDMQPRITNQSVAQLGSVSLLGEAAVDITPSSQGTPVPEWGYVKSQRTTGSLAEVAATATESVQEATKLLQDIRAGRGTVGKLFTDDMLWNEINTFVIAAQGVADNINRGRGSLGRLVQDPSAAKALEASLQNLEAVTSRIRSGQGSLGRLIADESLSRSVASATNKLDAVTGNLETLTGRINRGEGTAGKLLNDPELFNRLNSMSDRLDKLVASLQQGEGTAGQLLRDRQLYENMNGAVGELRSLVQDIRKDPRKYLNVRVSLF